MIYQYLFPCILLLSATAYFLGVYRAQRVATAAGGMRALHSLPVHYGMFAAMSCALPAIFVFGIWKFAEETVISSMVSQYLPPELLQLSKSQFSLVMNEIKIIALPAPNKAAAIPPSPPPQDIISPSSMRPGL